MTFNIPRRQRFPLPLGDNSLYTPPDPEPGRPYKIPNHHDYVLARQEWEETGNLEALWDMEDNVTLNPPPADKPVSQQAVAARKLLRTYLVAFCLAPFVALTVILFVLDVL